MSNIYTGVRVAGLVADNYACGHYRMLFPLTYLEKRGAYVKKLTEASAEAFADVDYIIAQRQVSPTMHSLLKWALSEGKTVISEQDDFMHATPNLTDSFNHYKNGSPELSEFTRIMLSTSHGLTVTTPELGKAYSKYCKNWYVLPNCIDFGNRAWPDPVFKEKDELVIGWAGSPSHVADINIIGPVMRELFKKYTHVKLCLFCSKALSETLAQKYDFPVDRIICQDYVSFEDYPAGLARFDIGLCPIENTSFNRAKSALKAEEYSACGIPYVASKVAPYQRYCDCGVDGYTANTTSEWVEKLSSLIEDTPKRKEMGEAAFTKVYENYNYNTSIHKWVDAWQDIRFLSKMGDFGTGEDLNIPVGRNDACPCGSGVKYKKCPNGCYPAFG